MCISITLPQVLTERYISCHVLLCGILKNLSDFVRSNPLCHPDLVRRASSMITVVCTVIVICCALVSYGFALQQLSVHTISTNARDKCSILSMYVQFGGESYWEIPSFHNTTAADLSTSSSYHIRLYGTCAASAMGNLDGGVALLLSAEDIDIRLPASSFYSHDLEQMLSSAADFVRCYFSSTQSKRVAEDVSFH